MTVTVTVLLFLSLILTSAAGLAAAFYLYGINSLQRKMLTESKRREKRLALTLTLWQNAFVRMSGRGALKPPPPKSLSDEGDDKPPPMRITAPSQNIAALKERQAKNPRIESRQVPPAVAAEFLSGQ